MLVPPSKANINKLLTDHLISDKWLSEPAQEKRLKSNHAYIDTFLVYLSVCYLIKHIDFITLYQKIEKACVSNASVLDKRVMFSFSYTKAIINHNFIQ